jgi:UDP-glucose 4-epimerase
MAQRILVTGGAGFIGSFLVRELVSQGFKVRVLDNLSTGSLSNLKEVLDSIEFIEGDLRDEITVEKAVRGVEAVVHLAALIDVAESVEKPDLYFDVNAKGTFNLAKASKNVSVFIFASSCAVYGEPVKTPDNRGSSPESKITLCSYIAGEAFASSYSSLYGYRHILFRFFNVYGPRQSKAYAGVISEFIKRISKNEPPVIFGDGEQTRDFVHVRDVARAVILALKNDGSGVYNIGSGTSVTINELANIVLKIMDRKLKPMHTAPRPGDIRHSYASIERAKRIGYSPTISLEDGIKELIGSNASP